MTTKLEFRPPQKKSPLQTHRHLRTGQSPLRNLLNAENGTLFQPPQLPQSMNPIAIIRQSSHQTRSQARTCLHPDFTGTPNNPEQQENIYNNNAIPIVLTSENADRYAQKLYETFQGIQIGENDGKEIFDQGQGFTGFFETLTKDEIIAETKNPNAVFKILIDPQNKEIISCSWGANTLRPEILENAKWISPQYKESLYQKRDNDEIIEWREIVRTKKIPKTNTEFSTGQLTMLEMMTELLIRDPKKKIALYEIYVITQMKNHIQSPPIVASFPPIANTSQQAVHESLQRKDLKTTKVGSRSLPNFRIGRYEYSRKSNIYELNLTSLIPHIIKSGMVTAEQAALILSENLDAIVRLSVLAPYKLIELADVNPVIKSLLNTVIEQGSPSYPKSEIDLEHFLQITMRFPR